MPKFIQILFHKLHLPVGLDYEEEVFIQKENTRKIV